MSLYMFSLSVIGLTVDDYAQLFGFQ